MATVRAISGAQDFSLSKGLKGYLCCFRSSQGKGSKPDAGPIPSASETGDNISHISKDKECSKSMENLATLSGSETVDLSDKNQRSKKSEIDSISVHSLVSRHSNVSNLSKRSAVSTSRIPGEFEGSRPDSTMKRSLESLNDVARTEAYRADEFADSALDSSFQSQIQHFKGYAMDEVDVGSDFDEHNLPQTSATKQSDAASNHSFQPGETHQLESHQLETHQLETYQLETHQLEHLEAPNQGIEPAIPVSQNEPLDVAGHDLYEGTKVISRCGTVRVSFLYNVNRQRLSVTVHEATDLPNENRVGAAHTQVRFLLLPAKKVRQKTKVAKSGGASTVYNESFEFKAFPDELDSMGLRMRLYGCERLKRERMIGESVITFSSLHLLPGDPTSVTVTLEPRSNLSHGDSDGDLSNLGRTLSGSCPDLQHGGTPELMIALTYNGTTGRLAVEVVKGSNFKNMASPKPPDTCIKLALISPNGQEITSSKTTVRRGQPNPLFKETFMFQVPLFQLPDMSLMVSVYMLRSMKRKEMIGWFTMGHTNSSDEELEHWSAMRDSRGEQVSRWHALLDP